jgi:hypothetical protein
MRTVDNVLLVVPTKSFVYSTSSNYVFIVITTRDYENYKQCTFGGTNQKFRLFHF